MRFLIDNALSPEMSPMDFSLTLFKTSIVISLHSFFSTYPHRNKEQSKVRCPSKLSFYESCPYFWPSFIITAYRVSQPTSLLSVIKLPYYDIPIGLFSLSISCTSKSSYSSLYFFSISGIVNTFTSLYLLCRQRTALMDDLF